MTKAVLFNPYNGHDAFVALPQVFPQLDMRVALDEEQLAAHLPGAQILVTSNRVYTPEMADIVHRHGGALRWVQFVTSGFDKAIASGMPKGLVVTNAAGLRAFAVAEHALALMLGLVRGLRAAEQARAGRAWARDVISPGLDNLSGKHLVIVGTGAIGQEIARKAKAFDMRVTGVSRSSAPLANFDALRPREDLVACAREADILMVAATYDAASTHGMISRAAIDALRPHATLVNIARGLLVDEAALIEALQEKLIAGAGLDVMAQEPLPPDSPLWSMDNVLLTPHVGGAGSAGAATHASMFADNLRLWFAGLRLGNVAIERT
ncbi:MAG: hypothetical protein JWN93_714 [Hyphomicrobiales bacterium]|nr:hypothetical protein [Hyphomicrobiales bacterium]